MIALAGRDALFEQRRRRHVQLSTQHHRCRAVTVFDPDGETWGFPGTAP
jgi:hypothetical protein